MLPVVAIIGRPNVGKSTLFNCLTRSRDAIVSDFPGMTRDRQFGEVKLHGRQFIVVDTGGMSDQTDDVGQLITQQAQQAINDADKLIFVIDGKAGITPDDVTIAKKLRRSKKPLFLVANKTEGLDPAIGMIDAYEMGMGQPINVSAAHNRGLLPLLERLFPDTNTQPDLKPEECHIKLAIVGRPNVGKSTLTNRMLGEERVIVHDSSGTTRDSIYIPFTRLDTHYTIIDTAGVRKRKKVQETPEKFSVVKTLQAIKDANVVLFVIDANLGVSEQDLKLFGFILDSGKALVIAVNKWDGLTEEIRQQARNTVDRHLDFIRFARVHFISALHGTGVGNLFDAVKEAFESANKKLSTPMLTRLLQQAVEKHSPPMVNGRRVKLRYAHVGGHNPPRIIIHGNQLDDLPESYRRFLAHYFHTKLSLYGTPVHIEFKMNKNPYAKK